MQTVERATIGVAGFQLAQGQIKGVAGNSYLTERGLVQQLLQCLDSQGMFPLGQVAPSRMAMSTFFASKRAKVDTMMLASPSSAVSTAVESGSSSTSFNKQLVSK